MPDKPMRDSPQVAFPGPGPTMIMGADSPLFTGRRFRPSLPIRTSDD